MLAKLKDTAGDQTLKIEDLEQITAKAAKNNVAELVKAEGTTSTADIKAAIKEQTGEDVTDKVAKRYRKDAEQRNLFDAMKNAKDAGYTKDEIEANFQKQFRNNVSGTV